MQFSVEELLSVETTRWDRRIAADLATELECQLAEKSSTIPEMRRLLAVKGYRELRKRVENDLAGLSGEEAVQRMAFTFRAFANERPGLSAATFRNSTTDFAEWRHEGELLAGVALDAFKSADLTTDQAMVALQILRALVRGFVIHEMASSFMDDINYDESYALAVKVFICGLEALRRDASPNIMHRSR